MRISTPSPLKKTIGAVAMASAMAAASPAALAQGQPAPATPAPPPAEPLPRAAPAAPAAPPVLLVPPPTATPEPPAWAPQAPGAAVPEPAALPPPPIPRYEPYIPFPIDPNVVPPRRSKVMRTSVGIPPTSADLGNEADLSGGLADSGANTIYETTKWNFSMKGYLRAPLRISYGPRDDSYAGNELHSPPRMAAGSSSNWAYNGIARNPVASIYAAVTNPRVSGVLILTANTFPEVGYQDLDQLGGLSQGYIVLKQPDLFGSRGGMSLMMGSFSNRYGNPGPRQSNSGFYGTYLFGRTHVAGYVLAANIDLTERTELIIEQGFGAKLDVLPRLGAYLPKQMYTPGDPPADLGSNFLHHAHVGIRVDEIFKAGAHYLTSWTPDDRRQTQGAEEARLSVVGADMHVDHPRWGSGYVGFSHVWGENLLSLDNALQVVHGSRGYDFKLQYFGNKLRPFGGQSNYIPNDSGRVETVIFQYIVRSNQLLGQPQARRGWGFALFGMFSHAYSPPTGSAADRITLAPLNDEPGVPQAPLVGPFTVNDNKLKYGAMVDFSAFRYVSFALRFDRVQPTQMRPQNQNYTALTGQVILRTNWKSKEHVIVSYSRFLLDRFVYPDSPYSSIQKVVDPHLFLISAVMSL